MSFLTGLRPINILSREPALGDYCPDYTNSFPDFIDESKSLIDNKLRSMGYDLDKLGKKIYFFNFDNDAHASSVSSSQTEISNDTKLLIINSLQDITTAEIKLHQTTPTVTDIKVWTTAITAGENYGYLIPAWLPNDVFLTIRETAAASPETISANTLQIYLTDASLYFVHLYKTLEIIFQSIRSESGDLFQMQAEYYRGLYENELDNLVTYYDSNNNGTADPGEMNRIRRTSLIR